jgi:hypothetical protein
MNKITKIILAVISFGVIALIIQHFLSSGSIITNSSIVGPSTTETKQVFNLIDEIKNTNKIEDCKKFQGNGEYSCVLGIVLNNKDFSLCKTLIDIPSVNMCLDDYYASNPGLDVCKEMIFENDPYYERKTQCIFDFAIKSKDKSACEYLSTENLKTKCAQEVNNIN